MDSITTDKNVSHGKRTDGYGSYVLGFVLSVALTLASYFIVSAHANSGHVQYSHASIMVALSVFALTQFIVQIVCFLHLGAEARPRWRLLVLLFTILVVVLLVGGSLWVMYNLDYNMSHQPDTYEYLREQEDL